MAEKNGFAPRRGGFRGRNHYQGGGRGRGGPRGRGQRGRSNFRGRGSPRGGPNNRANQHANAQANAVNKDCTVLVRNLPSHAADWQTKLTALFKDCGPIEKMEFVKNGARDEGVFTFTQEDSVEKALGVHGSLLEGRHIIVDVPEKNDVKFENTSVKVECGADVIEEDVWTHFESCGAIKGVRVKHDNRKAHILFENEDAVAKALAKNGSQLNEAPISVVRWRSWRACQVQNLGVAVFGLLHRSSRDEVIAHFKECGNICSVWVEFPRDSSIRRALIVFEDEEGAKNALMKNETLLGKDKIRVRHWDGRKFINAVFIGGVPYGTAPTDLWKIFQTCGTIDNVHFVRFNQSYAARRACIEFEDPEGATKALELDNIEIKGKPIKVFASLEDWDQHIANFKETQKNQEAGAKEEEGEEGDAEFEEGDDGANGEALMDDGQGDDVVNNGIKVEPGIKQEVDDDDPQQTGKRKAAAGGQTRGKARKLR